MFDEDTIQFDGEMDVTELLINDRVTVFLNKIGSPVKVVVGLVPYISFNGFFVKEPGVYPETYHFIYFDKIEKMWREGTTVCMLIGE